MTISYNKFTLVYVKNDNLTKNLKKQTIRNKNEKPHS